MLKFTLSNLNDIKTINTLSNNEYPQASIYFSAKEEDKLLCYCVFILKTEYAQLIDVKAVEEYDEYLMITTCKATFNAIDLSGVKKIVCENNKIEPLLTKLRFEKTKEGEYFLNLEGYFTPCNCKNTNKNH